MFLLPKDWNNDQNKARNRAQISALSIIPQIPDLLFILCKKEYLKRKTTDFFPIHGVINTTDHDVVTFEGSHFSNLLSGPFDPDDHIVFKFICNHQNQDYSQLNITPVIMGKNSTRVKKYSGWGGNGLDLTSVNDVLSIQHLQNYIERRRILSNEKVFKNDAFGLAYKVSDFIDTFGPEPNLTIHLIIGNFTDFYVPKTSIAIAETAVVRKYRTLEEFLEDSDMYNHGAECCPITSTT